MRSAIAKIPGVKDVDVSIDEKFLRFTCDAKTPIQTVMRAILGENNRFPSRLVLQLENPAANPETVDKARTAVVAVPGVRQMSLPDNQGIVLVTLHLDKNTLLPDLLQAANSAGLPLRNPQPKKPK